MMHLSGIIATLLHNWKVKGSIHFSNFLCNDILLNNVKFLIVDKSYPNNLLGRDLIEKLNLFPGVKNVNIKKFEDVVNNYKIDNSSPIKNLSKTRPFSFFSEG